MEPMPAADQGGLRASAWARARRVRFEAIFAAQSGVAAGLAWFIAHDILDHPRPYFAPASAVIVLSAGVGLRWRRAIDLTAGVCIGIAIGDSLILLIGVGPVQIAAVVTLAIIAMAFLGGGSVAIGQAAATSALIATLAPPSTGIFFERLFDAVIGGVAALLVMSLLLPFNPLTRVQREISRAFTQLAQALTQASHALEATEPQLADEALADLRAHDRDRETLRDAVEIGRETATVAPLRWGSRAMVQRYGNATVHIDRATRNVRMIEWRVSNLLRHREPVPRALSGSLNVLAAGVDSLRKELADGRNPTKARALILDAVRAAGTAYADGLGRSGSVVVAQIEGAAADLLRASGVEDGKANAQVHSACQVG
jgi:uncharacterized membrane protein YgaE (UPF0421/DUF939 family)